MQRSFQLTSSFICLGCLILYTSPTQAQEKKKLDVGVTFETFDGVDIHGSYWPSPNQKGKEAPVAILLHKIGGRRGEDGWKELAEELQKAGFAVLSFDFRGHGESIHIKNRQVFWNTAINSRNLSKKIGPELPKEISHTDFKASYMPHLVNDIAAAKRYLEERHNDTGECNISNLVLIGAEDGATLGALWLATETKRYNVLPNLTATLFQYKDGSQPESKDVAACVWINMSGTIGPQGKAVNATYLKNWLKDAGNNMDNRIPMAFVYGDEDKAAATNALAYVKSIRPTFKPNVPVKDELQGTNLGSIAGTKLQGAKLLTVPKTRETIVKNYLQGFIFNEKKGLSPWVKREGEKDFHGWVFSRTVPLTTASLSYVPLEKRMNPVPVNRFGFQ